MTTPFQKTSVAWDELAMRFRVCLKILRSFSPLESAQGIAPNHCATNRNETSQQAIRHSSKPFLAGKLHPSVRQ